MNKYYFTKKQVYLITCNEDGSLSFLPHTANAGLIISSRGGIQGFLASCIEDERPFDVVSLDYATKKKMLATASASQKAQQSDIAKMRIASAYNCMLQRYGMSIDKMNKKIVIDATVENIYLLMRYLRTIPMSRWSLPTMSQSYSCSMYDCDGTIAVAIILKKGLLLDGDCVITKLQYGAPRGYLKGYTNIGRI